MGLGGVSRDTRPGDAAAVGAAWFPLEPRASGMAAPLRRVPFGQRHRPAPEVFLLFPRRRSACLIEPTQAALRSGARPSCHEHPFRPQISKSAQRPAFT